VNQASISLVISDNLNTSWRLGFMNLEVNLVWFGIHLFTMLMFSIFSGIIMYWRNTENWETYKFFKFSLQTTCTHGLMNSYKILNIQFLLSAFFYYISEAYVYKLFHSLCTEKLMFLYFFWHYHVLEEHRKLRNIQIFQIFFTNNLYAWAYEFL
jgi:hypothetical protein